MRHPRLLEQAYRTLNDVAVKTARGASVRQRAWRYGRDNASDGFVGSTTAGSAAIGPG